MHVFEVCMAVVQHCFSVRDYICTQPQAISDRVEIVPVVSFVILFSLIKFVL